MSIFTCLTPTEPTDADRQAVEALFLGAVELVTDLTVSANAWMVFGDPQKVLNELEGLLQRGTFVTGRLFWMWTRGGKHTSTSFDDVNALIRDLRGRLKRKQGRSPHTPLTYEDNT